MLLMEGEIVWADICKSTWYIVIIKSSICIQLLVYEYMRTIIVISFYPEFDFGFILMSNICNCYVTNISKHYYTTYLLQAWEPQVHA